MRSLARGVVLYLGVELAAAAALIWALGPGWALLVLAATFMAGVLLCAAQVRGQVGALRSRRVSPQDTVTDGVLIGLGSFLVFLPGIVSTLAGALMLAPVTRGVTRPVARGMLTRLHSEGPATRRIDYIDGEVIEDAVALTR